MKYNQLQVSANKDRKRVGRGITAGGGKTAGRGTKGQNARTGKSFAAHSRVDRMASLPLFQRRAASKACAYQLRWCIATA